ncbi:DUF5615 family PIN-like protein [Bernardetia sp. MNP-M8]|uniref:DUF5615 family PIN-like protein n=1 Tax=Bernardetia sp. MNP-M8 TaxID=3127470 RepID=UPI0030D3E923
MTKYLIDVNLPYHFSLWNNENYVHQKDLDSKAKDNQIWEFAKENNLTVITKDSDFSNKILLQTPPPKVIHIKFGNMKMAAFYELINKIWDEVLELNKTNKLITIYEDRIEVIE